MCIECCLQAAPCACQLEFSAFPTVSWSRVRGPTQVYRWSTMLWYSGCDSVLIYWDIPIDVIVPVHHFKVFLYLSIYFVWIVYTHVHHCEYVGVTTTFRSWCCLSTTWVFGIGLKSLGLAKSTFAWCPSLLPISVITHHGQKQLEKARG